MIVDACEACAGKSLCSCIRASIKTLSICYPVKRCTLPNNQSILSCCLSFKFSKETDELGPREAADSASNLESTWRDEERQVSITSSTLGRVSFRFELPPNLEFPSRGSE